MGCGDCGKKVNKNGEVAISQLACERDVNACVVVPIPEGFNSPVPIIQDLSNCCIDTSGLFCFLNKARVMCETQVPDCGMVSGEIDVIEVFARGCITVNVDVPIFVGEEEQPCGRASQAVCITVNQRICITSNLDFECPEIIGGSVESCRAHNLTCNTLIPGRECAGNGVCVSAVIRLDNVCEPTPS